MVHWVLLLIALTPISPALATGYVYKAICKDSYSKQGEDQDDLTKVRGKPIKCDSVVLALLDNGHVLFQVTEKTGKLTPLGFAGPGLDYDTNPNFVTLPVQNIYLPRPNTSASAVESIQGVEGFCFFDGGANIRALTHANCAAKIQLGTERLVYHIQVIIIGTGQAVPLP
jgi:hypothetical protein